MILAYLRTIILYLVLIGAVRIMGKRQIGQMEASEFVVAMLVADLAAIPMQDGSLPLLSGLVPIFTVLGLELVCSFLILKSIRLRRLFCGKPVILVDKGKILTENLRKSRITLEELIGHLRQKDVLDISQVEYAILETDGNLSVFPFAESMPASARDAGIPVKKQRFPVTVIADGHIYSEDLLRTGRDEKWLQSVLKQHGAGSKDTLLLTVDDEGNVVWIPKENDC